MSGETQAQESGWTVDTYAAHNEALRASEEKFQTERDRRYAEVATEREKALKIKETADLAALGLAREIQTYKDEKANELRSQIERERGSYATKDDLQASVSKLEVTIKPISEFVTAQQGRSEGVRGTTGILYSVLVVVVALAGLWLGSHRSTVSVPPSPSTVTVTTTP
jgi:hypothetical protein